MAYFFVFIDVQWWHMEKWLVVDTLTHSCSQSSWFEHSWCHKVLTSVHQVHWQHHQRGRASSQFNFGTEASFETLGRFDPACRGFTCAGARCHAKAQQSQRWREPNLPCKWQQFPSECPNLFLTAVNKRPGFMKFIWFLLTPGYDWIHYHLDPSGASDPVAPETCLEGEPCWLYKNGSICGKRWIYTIYIYNIYI